MENFETKMMLGLMLGIATSGLYEPVRPIGRRNRASKQVRKRRKAERQRRNKGRR